MDPKDNPIPLLYRWSEPAIGGRRRLLARPVVPLLVLLILFGAVALKSMAPPHGVGTSLSNSLLTATACCGILACLWCVRTIYPTRIVATPDQILIGRGQSGRRIKRDNIDVIQVTETDGYQVLRVQGIDVDSVLDQIYLESGKETEIVSALKNLGLPFER